MAVEGIATASGIQGLEVRQSPPPGLIFGRFDTRVDILAADKATGHAIGADIAIIDEAGLLPERSRPLWNAILSSVSGRNGRLISISIRGDGPMFSELADRAGEPGVYWREWAAPADAAYDDEAAWHAANPGLTDGIKSVEYMAHMARRAMTNPADAPSFAAYDLNLPQAPSREMILTVAQWSECVIEDSSSGVDVPLRHGPCFVGIDLGGSASMTAAVAYWPETGRLVVFAAFPAVPDLASRGQADGVGGLYERMRTRGELWETPGRTTDVPVFIDRLASALGGERIAACAADRYRRQECMDAMSRAGVTWPMVWRGQGASHTADGSADVRAFQRECLEGHVRLRRNLVMESAIASSSVVRDAAGNPKLDKAKAAGRIDALQAGVLALGLGHRWRSRPRRAMYRGLA